MDRGISEMTGRRIVDFAPMFYFREDEGDKNLHRAFIKKYKNKNETPNTNTSKS